MVQSWFPKRMSSATPWTVSRQVPLSKEFSRQENWSGLPFPTSGDLPNPGIESVSLVSALAGGFFTTAPPGKPMVYVNNGILLSHKKNEMMPFAATWMQLETIILSEISQKEKNKYHMISLMCRI